MTATQKVDADVQGFVSRCWTLHGETMKAIDIRHSRFAGAQPTPVLLLEGLEQYKDDPTSRRLALTIDDKLLDYSRDFSGTVVFELCALGDKLSVLETKRVKKKGQARDDEELSTGAGDTETVRFLLEQNFKLTKLAVETAQYNRASDFRERERIMELSTACVATGLETQITFATGMQNLLNQDQERKLALRKALRIDAAQEMAMKGGMKLIPAILERLTKGTMFEGAGKEIGLAPHLKTILEGLEKDPEKAMMLFSVLKEIDGGKPAHALLQIMESVDEEKAADAHVKEGIDANGIKVEEKPAPPAPNGAGTG